MKMFTNKSKCFQITFLLYEERINKDFENLLLDSGYGFAVSPLHTPDDKDKKPHRHGIIKDMHGHPLDFNKVDALLEALNPQHCTPVELSAGYSGVKDMCKYFVHITLYSRHKQQFDLRDPELCDVILDENGYVDGLLSAYAPYYGVVYGNGLDFFSLIRQTIREQADERRAQLENARVHLLEYIYSNCCCNFADFVKYATAHELLNAVVADNAFYYRLIRDMRSSHHYEEKTVFTTENNECKKEINEHYNTISNCYSYVVSILMVADLTFTDNLVHTFIDEYYNNDMDELLIANDIDIIRDFNTFIGRDIN